MPDVRLTKKPNFDATIATQYKKKLRDKSAKVDVIKGAIKASGKKKYIDEEWCQTVLPLAKVTG